MALWMALAAFLAAVADRIYEAAIERGLSFAQSELSLVQGVEAEIEKLKRTLDRIHAVLADADERRYIEDDSVRLWLRHLKDVAFDADDLLDEFQTHLNESKLQSSNPTRKRKRRWYSLPLPSLPAVDPILLKRRRFASKIAEIRESLDAVNQDRKDLQLRQGDARRRIQVQDDRPLPQAGALQDVSRVHGRARDVDRIVNLLKVDGRNDVPVFPLVGMGGLGKTTIAGIVFEDGRIKDHFNLRIWVCVSKEFDENTTTREMIQAITKRNCDSLSLDTLQHRLDDLVRGKRFLLVLDNVWREDRGFWETTRVPLLAGADGSKVLITTRSKKVANLMSKGPPIPLPGLGFDDCWLLFRERAFASSSCEQLNLAGIGMEIVRRCQGSPLAAKSLGGLLYNVTDEDEWRSVLNEMWELEENENDILSTMKVSYDHLPLHLKRCFGYCSIFPNGYEFDKDELVKLWLAEGFIQRRGRRRLETIGGKYFDDLLWRSFFQNSDSNEQSKQKYKMPSLIHDLAQSVSIYECTRMERDAQYGEPRKPRYASVAHRNIDDEVVNELCRYESLRTLLLHGVIRMPLKQVLHDLFAKFECLRTLDLRNSQVEELPSSIGDLKHLRYLGLYNTRIKRLPESVSGLYNLQALELGECYELLELPEGMSNLVNLRHLGLHIDWDKGSHLVSMPPGIGRLTSLQTLSRFAVTSRSGCGIGELKDLSLRGELCISKLENVASLRDAREANLKDKQYIEVLILQWSSAVNSNAQHGVDVEQVIGKLRPHNRIRNLWIDNYSGVNFPSWIGDPSFLTLESLRLSHCISCRILPHLGQLPRLMNLRLDGMHGLESIVDLPPAVANLEIRDCKRLSTLPELHSLRELVVVGGNEAIFRWILNCSSLSSLTVSRFQELKRVSGSSFQQLTSLKKLKIEECNKLVSLDEREGLQDLTCLEYLEISSCPELTSLPGGLHSLPSLLRLEIRAVPKLASMPGDGLPVGLQRLAISGCPLLGQRCRRDGGVDWPKIEHIPYLEIDSP